MRENTRKEKITLIVFLFVMIFAVGSIAFAYFESSLNYEKSLAFNTITGGGPFTFTAYSNTEININVTKSEMDVNNVSENILKTDNATVTVDLTSEIDEKITCSYDIVWVWDSEEKYLAPTTTLPYTSADGKVYPYEFSIVFDGKKEINVSDLDWQSEDGIENKYAYLARNQRITANSPEPVKVNHTISINIYNLPVDQKDLFKNTFLSHLEIRNNECKVATGPEIENVEVIAKTSNSIDIEVTTDDSENVKLSYYYKEAGTDEYIPLVEDTPDKTAKFPGLKQDTTYTIKVVAENEDGSSEYILDVTTEKLEETEIRIKDDINWTGNGDAWVELETDTPELNIKYKVNDEEQWHDYTGPIEGLHHGDKITAILTDGTNETGETEFIIEDTLPPEISMGLTQTSAIEGHAIPLGVTLTDNESGISLTESKWYLDFEDGKVGYDSEKWENGTSFTSVEEMLNLLPDEPGVYYIHILAVDNAGNKAEQVLGQFTYTDAVAETGGVNYSSIQSAINAVPTNNVETVVNLLVDTQENNMTTLTGQNIILNLGEHTVDGTFSDTIGLYITDESTLTITNGTMKAADRNILTNRGILYLTSSLSLENASNGYPAVANAEEGVLNISGTTIKSLNSSSVYNDNIAIIDSANLESADKAIHNHGNATVINVNAISENETINSDGEITIQGGTYTSQNSTALYNNGGSANINGGRYTSQNFNTFQNGGSATINGGAVFSGGSGSPVIYNKTASTLNMTSGEIISTSGGNLRNYGTATLADVTIITNNTIGVDNYAGTVYLKGNTHITKGDDADSEADYRAGIYNCQGAYMYIEDNTVIEDVIGNLILNHGTMYIRDNAVMRQRIAGPAILNYERGTLYIVGGSSGGVDISHDSGNTVSNYGQIDVSGTVSFHNEQTSSNSLVLVNHAGTFNLTGDNINAYSDLGSILSIKNGEANISGGTYTSTSASGIDLEAGKLHLSDANIHTYNATIVIESGEATIQGGTYTSQNLYVLNNRSSTTVTGDTVFSGRGGSSVVYNANSSTLNMTSGEIISTNSDNVRNYGTATLTDVTIITNNTMGVDNYAGTVYLKGNTHITSGDLANPDGNLRAGVYNDPGAYMYIEDNTVIENVVGNLITNEGIMYISDNVVLASQLSGTRAIYNRTNAELNINGGSSGGVDISHSNGNIIHNYGHIDVSGKVTIHNELANILAVVNYAGIFDLTDENINVLSSGNFLWIKDGEANISGGTYVSNSGAGIMIDDGKLHLSGATVHTNRAALDIAGGEVTIHGGTYISDVGNALSLSSDTAIVEPIDNNTTFSSGGTYPTVYVGNSSITVGNKVWVEFTDATISNSVGNAIQNSGNILIRDNVSFGSSADYAYIENNSRGILELRNITIKSRYNRVLYNNGSALLNNAQILDGNAEGSLIVLGVSIVYNNGNLDVKNGSLLQGLNGNALYNNGTVNLIDNVVVEGTYDEYPTLINTANGTLNVKLESGSVPPEISAVNSNTIINRGVATITGNAKIYNVGDDSGAMAISNQGIMTVDSATITSVNCVALSNNSVPSSENPDLDTLVVKGTTTISSSSRLGSFRTGTNSRTNVQGNVTILGTSDQSLAFYNWGILTMNGTGITIKATMDSAFVNEEGATANLTGVTIDNNGLIPSGGSSPAYVNAGTTTATNVKFISNYTALYNIQGTVYTTGGSIASRNPSNYYAIINNAGATTTTNGTTITTYRLDR